MNKFLIIIIIGLSILKAARLTRGGLRVQLEQEQQEVESTQLQQTECPTECFCDKVLFFATCIGDDSKTSLPNLSWLTGSNKMRRIEIHDFMLSDLLIDDQHHYKLFHYVQELHLSHNQIRSIHFLVNNFNAYDKSESYFPTSTSTNYNNNNNSNNSKEKEEKVGLLLLDLSFNNLTYFESREEFTLLKSLDLSHNKIHRIQVNGLEKLETLNLKSNGLVELREDIFQSLKSLQYINLDSNLLKSLSSNLFSNLPSLAHLILSSNPLQFDYSSFLLNSKTQFIDISNVGLEQVPSVMYRTVRDLRLNNNKLKRILESDFESYPNVGLLVLDENQIETIENDAFGRMDFLTSLWLNGNRLSSFPQNLPSSLVSLQLEENRINYLNSTNFNQLYNLQNLNLHINQISSIDPDVFSALFNLRSLNLGTNQIDTIYSNTFNNLTKLNHLDLSGNPIKVIVHGAFNHFPSLSSLSLSRMNEKGIEFDASIFDQLSLLTSLDLSSSKYLTLQVFGLNIFSRGWLKSLRELNIERCDLSLELSNLCSQLIELESLAVVKVYGNSFNTSIMGMASNNNSSQISSTTTGNSDNENYDGSDDNLDSSSSSSSLQKLCPSSTLPITSSSQEEDVVEESKNKEMKVKEDGKITNNTNTTTTTSEEGDETSLVVDLDKKTKKTVKQQQKNKVSLTLTTNTTTTKSPTTAPIISNTSTSINNSSRRATTTTIISSKVSHQPTTRRNRPTSRSLTTNTRPSTSIRRKIMQEESPTTLTSTSTSSYFEPRSRPTTKSKTLKNNKKYQETNEDTKEKNEEVDGEVSTTTTGDEEITSSASKEKEKVTSGIGRSIDGFPAVDLSGRTIASNTNTGGRKTSSSNNNNNNNNNFNSTSSSSKSLIHQHNDDFAKGSFHGILPQKMYLSQTSALAASNSEEESPEDENSNKSLIFKTIFISAGTCLLSVFILLGFGLLLFRLNGGRFVRSGTNTRSNENPSTSESYRRLEDKQELELGFSNKMYYEGGQVYHIS